MDYQDKYDDCLGPGDAVLTFSERVDTVTRNSLGVEISRIEGVTRNDTYRVKRELAPLFGEVFSRPEVEGEDEIYRLLFGDDGVSRLVSGVRELMDDFTCDAPEIEQFETGLIAYHDEMKRRWARR